jgi:hypothetical protein
VALWIEFVTTVVESRRRDCVLLHRSAWQLGWALDERIPTYRQAVRPHSTVSIDLNNKLMVAIFGIVIGSRLRKRLSQQEIGIFRRVDWDRRITRKLRDNPMPQVEAYLSEMNGFFEGYREPRHTERVKGILGSPSVKGLMLVQESDRELVWTVLAANCGLDVYQPEGVLGSVKRKWDCCRSS